MQRQVHQPESKLAHLAVGSAEIARVSHLVEKLGWNGLAGLVMASEQIQRFAFPGPVLHDLGRQFHEVPSDVHTRKSAQFHAAQTMVQKMTELVKNGLDLTVSEQGR